MVSMEGSKIRFKDRLLRDDAIIITEYPAGYLDFNNGEFRATGLDPGLPTTSPLYVTTGWCKDRAAKPVASPIEALPRLSSVSFMSALRVALSREAGDLKPYGKDIEILSDLSTRCAASAATDSTCRMDRVGSGAPQGGFIPKPIAPGAQARKLYAYAGPLSKAVAPGGNGAGFRVAVFIDPRDRSRLDRRCSQGGPWNDILSLCMEPLFDAVIISGQESTVTAQLDSASGRKADVAVPNADASPVQQAGTETPRQVTPALDENATFDIHLSCTINGNTTLVSADTEKRYVRAETHVRTTRSGYNVIATYLDGRSGPVIKYFSSGNVLETAMGKAVIESKGNQSVTIDANRISFGISLGNETAQTTIDRQTGILRAAGGVGTCTVVPNKGAIP